MRPTQSCQHPHILDATRTSDGYVVTLEKTSKLDHPYEADIGQYLSSEPLSSDPRNHYVPIYDVLQVPDEEDSLILMMPFLRTYNNLRFQTTGEAIEFFRQAFEVYILAVGSLLRLVF